MNNGEAAERGTGRGRRATGGPRSAIVVTLLLLAMALSWPAPGSQLEGADEYRVKAAFLLNFAKFVEWPLEALGDPADPLRLGIVGRDPFDGALDLVAEKGRVRERAIVVHRMEDLSQLDDCHVVFISAAESRRLEQILGLLEGRPVLTVGESRRFLELGGMIRFKLVDRKVRFEIAPSVVKDSGLKVSSKLLGLAEIVEEGTRADG